MFCGEAEQHQTFISETSYVKVVFHTDNFTDQVKWSIQPKGINIVLQILVHHGTTTDGKMGKFYCSRLLLAIKVFCIVFSVIH